jgi:hypothetical protein
MTTAAATLSAPQTAAATLTADSAAPAPASAPTIPQNPGWWDGVKNPDTKAWLANKAYPDPDKAFESHQMLEKAFGADRAGRAVILPKDDADVAGWKDLYTKLGVPDTVDGYKLPLPEGTDPAFAKSAAQWFHEAGVPPKAADKIATKWNEWAAAEVQRIDAAEKAKSEADMAELQRQWGGAFTEKRELAQRGFREFAKQFGLDAPDILARAETAMGAANLTKFFAGLGSLNSESTFAASDANGQRPKMTHEQGQARIKEIIDKRAKGEINDKEWRTTYGPLVERLGTSLQG